MPVSVLLVEDDFDLAETVVQFLEIEGMVGDHAFNGESGLSLARENVYDVLVLDVMLPGMDGLTLCTRLRQQGVDTPVIMLTARDTLNDKLDGFKAGTDDYLVKPFAMAELVARIRALAQRRSSRARVLTVGDLVMDLDSRSARRSGRSLRLTPTGWDLLKLLMQFSPAVVSRKSMEEALWGGNPPESNTLKVHIHKLRQQVDGAGEFPMIQTVPGHGFILRSHETA